MAILINAPHTQSVWGLSLLTALPPGSHKFGHLWHAYDLFLEWSFDLADELAPHRPWAVRWHRGVAALRTLHGRFAPIDDDEIRPVFGDLIGSLLRYFGWGHGYVQVIDGGAF